MNMKMAWVVVERDEEIDFLSGIFMILGKVNEGKFANCFFPSCVLN